MFCPNCGVEVKENDKFCEKCGEPLVEKKAEAEEPGTKRKADKKQSNKPAKSKKKVIIPICTGVIVLLVTLTVILLNVKKTTYRNAVVNDYNGNVELSRAGGQTFDVEVDMKLIPEDEVEVSEASKLDILVDDDKHIAVMENSKIVIETEGNPEEGLVAIELKYGRTIVDIENQLNDDDEFLIKTPNATVSVRGTMFEVEYDRLFHMTHVKVTEGTVKVWTNAEDVMLYAGEEVYIIDDKITTNEQENATQENVTIEETQLANNDSSEVESSYNRVLVGEELTYGSYQELLNDLDGFIFNYNILLTHEYYSRDYMYYDYDQDGQKEVILYLHYLNEGDRYPHKDVVFLDHGHGIKLVDILLDLDEYSFFCNYHDAMALYRWDESKQISWLELVGVHENGLISFTLEETYDFIINDLQEYDIIPLPLYEEWELL